MSGIPCPGCGKEHRWRDELAGRKLRCPCGVTFRAPETAAADAVSPAPLAETKGPQSLADVGAADPLNERLQRSRKQGLSSTSLLVLGGGGLLAVIAVIVILLLQSGEDDPTNGNGAQANGGEPREQGSDDQGSEGGATAPLTGDGQPVADGNSSNSNTPDLSAANTPDTNSQTTAANPPDDDPPGPTLWNGSLVDPPLTSTAIVPDDPDWSYVGPDWADDAIPTGVLSDKLLLLGGMEFQAASFTEQDSPAPLKLLTNEEGFRPGEWISPDGRFVLGESQTATSTERKLAVASTDAAAIVTRLEGVGSAPRFAEFLSADELLTIDREPDAPWQVNLYRLPESRPARSFTLPVLHEAYDDFTPEFAISPGRKFLAFGSADGVLRMIELASGDVTAELRFDLPRGRWAAAKSVEFSPDGTELAVWYKFDEYPGGPPNSRIVCWDLAGGDVLDQHDFNVSLSRVRNRLHHSKQLVWLPDGSGWIASGKWLVDRSSGKIVWALQLPDDAQSLALLEPLAGSRLLLGYLRNDPNAPKRNLVLRSFTLPENEIQPARATAQSGQQPDVPELPTDKVVDIL